MASMEEGLVTQTRGCGKTFCRKDHLRLTITGHPEQMCCVQWRAYRAFLGSRP